jgi:Undecaprenyl-phosphate glucose phosphotransferase
MPDGNIPHSLAPFLSLRMMLRLKLYRLFLKISVYLLPAPAFALGWALWAAVCAYLRRPAGYPVHGHVNLILFGTCVWALFAERYRVTSFDELFRERTGVRRAFSACVGATFVLLATLYFSRNGVFPRGLLVCDLLALLALTLAAHALFRVFCRNRAHLAAPTRLLIVGADRFAGKVAKTLQTLSFAPFQVAGFVRLPGQRIRVKCAKIFELNDLSQLNSDHGIDEAVIAIHPARFSKMPAIVHALDKLCLPARAIVDLGEGIVVREKLFQLGAIQMLDLTSTPAESLDYALLKRVFDICFSAAVLVLASPLLALIAALIRITSPGPALFAQERVGLNGKSFRMYKFRSMGVSPASESDTLWTRAADPRRTWFGSFLRRTSLDELPQFWNVLKGEMSVVGPRPERPHFVRKFLHDVLRYNHRHALKVGITGWAQVNGLRGDTSIRKRVAYDLYYLQNWSFLFDLRIILMTIVSGLINRHAY